MTNAPIDWTSTIAILIAGLALGALLMFFLRRREPRLLGDEAALRRKDLEAKRDALLQRLRDLDETASPDERVRLEKEAAAVLRELDAAPAPAAAGTATPAQSFAMSDTTKGFLWGAGSMGALVALLYVVTQNVAPRQEGGTVTGNTPMQQAPAPQQPDPRVAQLEAAVQRDPNNLQLRNDLAQAYLETDNLMAVFEQTKFVLDRSPNDSRALTFQGIVRMAMGSAEEAEQLLQRASKSDPKNLDSWVARAWMYAQQNRMADAESMIAEAKRQVPNEAARLDAVFRQMREATQQQPPQTAELPPDHPPVGGQPAAPQPPAPAPADGRSVTVTLDLDPSARGRNGVLYVMARNPAGGPPVAVKRLQVAQFPVTLSLSSADSMMGQPLPDKFRLEARLDSDGDAATKLPTDPTAMQNDVVPGTKVRLALK